ncbi:PKD domain-containing protein [Natronosalvus vescus]|uniref:PKD domain-containing protein n=1 Tax=Natronosalvus vescus TaxID=2953881 RepID=UPI0020902539|nr:PKD domain-containing protein [Natronosalvus vescus]
MRNIDADDTLLPPSPIEAGTYEEYEIELAQLLTESAEVAVSLIDTEGHGFARETAVVHIDDSRELVEGVPPTRIDADPAAGFEYPYFLYAPTVFADDDPRPLLVQPNNTGEVDDELNVHAERAERDINGWVQDLGEQLNAAAIVPVFPRPRSDPVDATHYIHALDRETMQITSGSLERVDLQLLNMAAHARKYLAEREYPVADDGIMLNGFSASGNFVERFVTLHPDEVVSATAGGLNGMVTLPIEEAKGHSLEFHIGVANLEELTGKPFDLDSYRDVPQFLYLGEHDTNDTIPYTDAWTGDFDETALAVYGDDMQEDRFPYCKAVHEEVNTAAVFRMYEDTGHSPGSARDDVAEFHERVLRGDDIDSIRADLGGNVSTTHAYIEFSPQHPLVGEQVAFDATHSSIEDREIVEYVWEFGDESTETGDLVTYTFGRAGGHNIRLTVTDDAGDVYESTTQIVVNAEQRADEACAKQDADEEDVDQATEEESTQQAADDKMSNSDADTDTAATKTDTDTAAMKTSTADDTVPGFSVGGAIAALSGAGYLLKRRLDDRQRQE